MIITKITNLQPNVSVTVNEYLKND